MAELVVGIGSSHTPQLSSAATIWADHGTRDARMDGLLGADGEYHPYEELLARTGDRLAAELTAETFAAKFDRAQMAVGRLARELAAARPEAVVVVGDDQRELFGPDGTPAIGLFLGDELVDLPPSPERQARTPADIRAAGWAIHAEAPDPYPVDAALSAHLAERLTADGFDLAVMSEQPAGRSLGHAFTFVRRRLGLESAVPIVPVLLNTYFPPNVPSPARCVRLGEAIGAALLAYGGLERVAIVASGGLSHFVVLEELDHRILDALAAHDTTALAALSPRLLRSGTSEALNWVTAGAALGGTSFELVDYVPGYRSPAGTGVGMAFALWRPSPAGVGAPTGLRSSAGVGA